MIRVATEDDAEKLLEIYAYYVKNTAVSFEYEVPSLHEFRERIRRILERYPYLVSEREGSVVGYAYAGSFHTRAAYSRAAETTIYVAKDKKRQGVGKELYGALEKTLALQNIINLNACIGYPTVEDEYLSYDSARFHERSGYRFVGEFHKCGYKFGRWYGIIWMEKLLSDHPENPPEMISFNELRDRVRNDPSFRKPGMQFLY